jgi:hypothetical protein
MKRCITIISLLILVGLFILSGCLDVSNKQTRSRMCWFAYYPYSYQVCSNKFELSSHEWPSSLVTAPDLK